MKAVHFGAGKIGRGFIGVQLSRSGYEVCFVCRSDKQIDLIKRKKQYSVVLANEARDTSVVKNITAVHITDDLLIHEQIPEADLVTTAVGASSLQHIAKVLAKGIEHRLKVHSRPLHVIACENAIGGSTQLKKHVYTHLPSELHGEADRLIAFPDAIIDRIVPEGQYEDPLMVKVEPFYEWVVSRPALKEGFPGIQGVIYADSMDRFIERKLFTVNTGHCSLAYLGYLKNYPTIQEAMKDSAIRSQVQEVLGETGKLLITKHGFGEQEHQRYIQKTLERFANTQLTDRLVRVGRGPLRKLSHNERLVRPAMQAYSMGMEVPALASTMAAALHFDYEKDPDAVKLQALARQNGIESVIANQMGIPETHPLYQQVVQQYEQYQQVDLLQPEWAQLG